MEGTGFVFGLVVGLYLGITIGMCLGLLIRCLVDGASIKVRRWLKHLIFGDDKK